MFLLEHRILVSVSNFRIDKFTGPVCSNSLLTVCFFGSFVTDSGLIMFSLTCPSGSKIGRILTRLLAA